MPRAKSSKTVSSDVLPEEPATKPKPVRRRAPRKRAVVESVATVSDTDVVQDTAPARVPDSVESGVTRKAPARVPETREGVAAAKKRHTKLLVMSVVFVGGIIASALLGMTDKGVIDVNARMREVSAQQAGGGQVVQGEAGQVIPVQNTMPAVPNGGLRGRGVGAATTPVVPPPEEVATTTASSTETATSTEEVSGESSDANVDSADTASDDATGETSEAASS